MDTLHREILEHQATAVTLVDGALRLVYLNPAAEALLATSLARSVGEPIATLLRDPEDALDAELREAFSAQQPFIKREAELQAPLAEAWITMDYTVTPLTDCSRSGLLLELQPLDRILRINREAHLSRIQQTTRELVRGLAHEVKNPLGGIRGAAQLLARELDREELREHTDIIIGEADRLRNLVDRMLGPNECAEREAVNVHEVLEHVQRLIDAESPGSVRIVRDFDPSLPEIRADREQLVQALLNIARNAQQAVSGQREPRIRFATRAVRQQTIGGVRHRLAIRVDVIDNGPGIPDALRERLFYPMISGRPGGSGLGLSIAQTIVAQHGGALACDSRPGDTCFSILLPLESHHDD